MHKLLKIVAVAGGLAVAAPTFAQYTFAQPGQPVPQPVEVWSNVARINLGVSFYNSGYYNCSYWYGYYPTYTCGSGSFVSYIPFTFGPAVDINLSGMNNISVGLNIMLGTVTGTIYDSVGAAVSGSKSATLWEPTIDYVAKFGPPTQDTVGRFRVGGGMYFGPNSGLGGAFRIGGGASFLNAGRLGIGLDLVLEGGAYQGYWIGGLQLLVSPEFHF